MSAEDTVDYRLESLEESRREQKLFNEAVLNSLNRIEIALTTSSSKHCPSPGRCMILERDQKVKWEADSKRFEALESAVDNFHKEFAEMKSTINKGLGAIVVLVPIASALLPYFMQLLKHAPTP